MEPTEITAKEIRDGVAEKKLSAREVTDAFLGRIRERDHELGAYITVFEEEARARAGEVDDEIRGGAPAGPLAGVPVALKDNILVRGARATAASRILETYLASYDATVVERLKSAGAIIIGKTNLDEFAMGSSTENSAFKLAKNPHDPTRVPGGSSGGSAVAVSSGMAAAALGSDTGGSIRQPAAFCGVVGLKPTYGAVSRSGLIAMASSLDQIGPITKTVEDAALLFGVIAGKDPLDATSVEYAFEPLPPGGTLKPLRIGVPKEYFVSGLDQGVARGVEAAIERFKKLGFKMREVSLPHTKYALSVYYIVMPAEVSANLARFDGIRYSRIFDLQSSIHNLRDIYFETRGRGFGAEVRRRVLLGTFVLSAGYYDAYYAKAQKVRRLIADDFEAAFKEVDVILAPVTPTLPFKIGEKVADPLAMYLSDILTIPANLAGLPAVSIPVERVKPGSGKLPVGFQLIGKHFREADILGLGALYEKTD